MFNIKSSREHALFAVRSHPVDIFMDVARFIYALTQHGVPKLCCRFHSDPEDMAIAVMTSVAQRSKTLRMGALKN